MTTNGQTGAAPAGNVRLLYVVNVAWFFTSHRLPLAMAAKRAGYEVHVAATVEGAGEVEAIEAAGFRFHRLRGARGGGNPFADVLTLFDTTRVITRIRPHAIHAITAKPIIFSGIVRRFAGVRAFVGAMTGLGFLFIDMSRRRLLRGLVAWAMRLGLGGDNARLIVQNMHDAGVLVSAGAVNSRRVVHIAGSGVDLERFVPAPEPGGVVNVVLPARMLRDKGVVEFCEAARIVRSRGVEARFLLAGGLDPYNPAGLGQSDLESLQSNCGVEWLGQVEDVPKLFRSCHIVCLPSYREGLPKALIEAAACARALVTTDVPGCRDVVSDDVHGLVVPARDAAALAVALERLILDRQLRERCAAAALARARSEFDVRSVIERTLALYAALLGEGPNPEVVLGGN